MAFVNIRTPAINHMLDFDLVRDEVVSALGTLHRLRAFALNADVRQRIMASL